MMHAPPTTVPGSLSSASTVSRNERPVVTISSTISTRSLRADGEAAAEFQLAVLALGEDRAAAEMRGQSRSRE